MMDRIVFQFLKYYASRNYFFRRQLGASDCNPRYFISGYSTNYDTSNQDETDNRDTAIIEHKTSTEVLITDNHRPVSLMGDGNPWSARNYRRKLRKQTDGVRDEIPIFLKLKYKVNPKEVLEQYPQITNFMVTEKPKEPVEDEINHFPYQVKNDVFIDENNKHNVPTLNGDGEVVIAKEPALDASRERLAKVASNLIKHLEDHDVDGIKDRDGTAHNLQGLKDEIWRLSYGSPDPSIPPSKIPCGGCGAQLHCQDSTIPGYIPSERFKSLSKSELCRTNCQRCRFLQEHNVALKVNVSNTHYPGMLSKIKSGNALVLLLVDLTDFPCSIWPGIVEVIGTKSRIIVVGNKVDLLPRDEKGYLSRVLDSLSQSLLDYGIDRGENVLDVHLISAKTGFGVEPLISKVFKQWYDKGDVFLVGCTNAGKSTLFNALLQSDLCHIRAVDLVQRATASVWPGTTLSLLKFPINRPSGLRLNNRDRRLRFQYSSDRKEQLLQESRYKVTQDPHYATLMGRIGITSQSGDPSPNFSEGDTLAQNVFNPDSRKFSGRFFCYDTPGTVYKDQILDLLTMDELMKTLPKEIITPRTFTLRSQQTLFLAGLARIDFLDIENLQNVFVTVFSSKSLPVHIIKTEEADLFYTQNVGTPLMEVPAGGPARMASFPDLKPREFRITGSNFTESTADIVLSSAGWVALMLRRDAFCRLKAYTPEGRGCYLRQPALLPYAVRLRGKRIPRSPAFESDWCSVVLPNTN